MLSTEYIQTPAKKIASPKAVMKQEQRTTLNRMSTPAIIWYLLKKHDTELLILVVVAQAAYIVAKWWAA